MRRRHRRSGFIILFGSRGIVGGDNAPPLQAKCPRCGTETAIVGKSHRTWFTLFFIPIIPIGGKKRFSECTHCNAQFPVPIEELRKRLSGANQEQSKHAITLYNSLR